MKEINFYQPRYIFHGDVNVTPPYIGFELEVNPNGKKEEKRKKHLEFLNSFEPDNSKFGFKYDCSIGEYGVEIVSHPGTINWHKTDGFVQEIFEKINKHEMNFGQNCGLHFHVDKNFFTQNEIAALDCFVNRPYIMRRLAYVGGRRLNGYCSCIPFKKEWGDSWGRTALHIAYKTIEFRFCKSTSSIDKFFKRMELIYCLSNFAKNLNLSTVLELSDKERFEKLMSFVKNMNLENLNVEDFNGTERLCYN